LQAIREKTSVCKRVFKDANGNVFDGHVNVMAEDKEGFLWITAIDRLIRWDRKNNMSEFYYYFFNDQVYGHRNLELRTICIDKRNRIWVGAIGAGVALFNRQTKTFQLITKDTSLGQEIKNTYVNALMEDKEGNIWACSFGGLYRIDPDNFEITTFHDHPVLKEASVKTVISLFEDNDRRLWIGTQRYGIYCYDQKKNEMLNYTTGNGLLANTANSIMADKYGNVYAAHLNGFSVIKPDGSIRNFSKANGLRYARCETILTDDNGFTWVANNKGIVRYDPANGRLEYFEENAGISSDGFRFDASCKTRDGNLFFGTNRGINYFDPLQIKNYTAQLRVNIYQLALPDSVIHFDTTGTVSVKHTDNSVQFYFTAINLTGSNNIAYEYMLEGYDNEWQKGTDVHEARYPSLPPGKYNFIVKASIDKIHWTEASNKIAIEVIPPFWKRWWFVLGASILLTALIVTIIQLRINRIRYKERLKTIYNKKISETEMKALRAQMNPHFIFNSLNSINKYILKNDHTNASRYLTRFAKLIRLILDNSNSREIPLSSELEALGLYIEMESLRFTNKFSYEITLQVPPLIIQPYVENAIWHGLLHKESGGRLTIQVKKTNDNMLQCVIEDNGIGRSKANELKSKSATANKSLGMKLTEERINMLNQYASLNATISITDLEDGKEEATGTRVILTIPI
jgi:sugar lactone lactonase YvrE